MKETIYRSQDSEAAIGTKVRRVVATAAKFAEMENTAFWEERAGDCVAVYEGPNEPTAADVIPCAEIGRHAEAWASELFDWCADMPDATGIGEPSLIDAETDDYTEFAHREVTIRIGDLMFCGGIRLEAFDGNGNKIRAGGIDGKDGDNAVSNLDATCIPLVRINASTLCWEISTDGGTTWTPTDIKAVGKNGEHDIFQSVTLSADHSMMIFVFRGSGESFSIPVNQISIN